jgi:hypothetical protein
MDLSFHNDDEVARRLFWKRPVIYFSDEAATIRGTYNKRDFRQDGKQPNARINRARRTAEINQVSRMKAALFALRLNELFGCVFDYRANVKMKSSGVQIHERNPDLDSSVWHLQMEPGEYLQISTSPSR